MDTSRSSEPSTTVASYRTDVAPGAVGGASSAASVPAPSSAPSSATGESKASGSFLRSDRGRKRNWTRKKNRWNKGKGKGKGKNKDAGGGRSSDNRNRSRSKKRRRSRGKSKGRGRSKPKPKPKVVVTFLPSDPPTKRARRTANPKPKPMLNADGRCAKKWRIGFNNRHKCRYCGDNTMVYGLVHDEDTEEGTCEKCGHPAKWTMFCLHRDKCEGGAAWSDEEDEW